jgi:uncharacterized tellurite resistance protein B-like protein
MYELAPFTPEELGDQSGLSSIEQEEIVKAIVAAIWADGKIHDREEQYLKQFNDLFEGHPKIQNDLKRFVNLRHPIQLKPINIPSSLSLKVFQTILSICSCDLDLDINEIYLIRETAIMLNIDISKRRKMISDLAKSMKSQLLNRLVQDMTEDEVYTLVTTTLQVVYDDNELVDKNLPYLNDLVRLTQEHHLIDRLNQELDLKPELDNVDIKVSINGEKAVQFIKFMLELSMSDGIWFQYELKMIREIAKRIEVPEEKVEWLIFSVHASYKLLLEI